MGVFISYSNHDEPVVRALARDIERARQAVWLDQELHGGEAWWQTILRQIRDADVFVLALSNNSQRSKPCRAEVEYARALGIPVLPVQIGPLDGIRSAAIADLQVVDYRERSADAGIALVAAVQDAAARRGPLPDPLPEPPAIPFEYLLRLGHAIDAPQLSPADQVGVLAQLRQGLQNEDDPGARRDIAMLLRNMRGRPDVTYNSVSEIDTLLATIGPAATTPTASPAAGWYPDQEQPQRQRYWDGAQWTAQVRDQRAAQQAAAGPSRPDAARPDAARPGAAQPQPGYQPQPDPPRQQPRPSTSPTPGYGVPQPPPVLSIIAMVLGVLSVAFFLIFFLLLLMGIAGIICGGVAIARRERLGVLGLSVAAGGLVLGIVLLLVIAASL